MMSYPLFSGLILPIQTRRSIRAFTSTPIEPKVLLQIMEAARWSASSNNEQPWRFVVASQNAHPQGHQAILETLVPFNQDWAKLAPVLLVGLARTAFEKTGQPNPHAYYDLGQAISQLSIQAQAHNIFVHQMAGFDIEKATKALKVPEGFEVVVVAALGYESADISALPEPLQIAETKARVRKPIEDIVFGSVFGREL